MNPITLAIEGAAIAKTADLDKLRLLELSTIDAFANGRASRGDFHAACSMLNICEQMAQSGVGPEALETCQAVQAALEASAKEALRTGKVSMSREGIAAMRDLYEYHDLQRQSIPRSEYERYIKRTFDKVRSKAPGVVEV